MCDTLIEENIPASEIPKYVYKVVQKTGDGKYVSTVMGEPLKLGQWKKAPSRSVPKDRFFHHGTTDMVEWLKRSVLKKYSACSSPFSEHHNGKWGVFKYKKEAENSYLNDNFMDKDGEPYPQVIVKCKIKGVVHKSKYSGKDTFLASHIMIEKEVKAKSY